MKIFSRRTDKLDVSVVYTTTDAWVAELVRSALLSEGIRADLKSNERVRDEQGKKKRKTTISVPTSRLAEAKMVISRTSLVISNREKIMTEQSELESQMENEIDDEEFYPKVKPEGEAKLLAEKDDAGKIFYYEANDVYELRLDMEFYKDSHYMGDEEWDEFINFSAQRQEFFILLKEKYPKLAVLLKEHKMRPQFLKLIEYSYGKSQPPKKKDSGF